MPEIVPAISRTYLSKKERIKLEVAQKNAERIISDLSPIFVHETEELFTSHTGVLVPNGHVLVGKALEEIEGMYCTISSQNLVLHHIKNKCVTKLRELEPPSDLIPVENGVVSVSTGELLPYKKGMNFHTQFPIIYNPEAKAREFFKFLNSIQHDQFRRQKILNSFARCLDRTPMKREAELFIGEHDTGKSTLLKVLRFMLGAKNCSSETLQNLTDGKDRWAMGNLLDKSANICADLQTVEIREVGKWKTISGGDPVTAEFKGKPKFEFLPYTKFFFACNKPPKITDKDLKEDLAFYERFDIIYFEEQLKPEEFDETLVMEDKPESSRLINVEEISGLFNHCLRILRGMRAASSFGYFFNALETKEIWFHESSQNRKVDDFVALKTVPKTEGSILVSEFKQCLNQWCLSHHQNPVSDLDINSRMKEKFGDQGHAKRRIWRGLEWRDQANQSLSLLDGQSYISFQKNISTKNNGGVVPKSPSDPSNFSGFFDSGDRLI